MKKQRVAIVGLGRWGKKLLGEFSRFSEVAYVCTASVGNHKQWLQDNYPKVKHTVNYNEVLDNLSIGIVAIATPIATHFELAKQAFLAKKHVFLEKPPATESEQVKYLDKLAKKAKKLLFVDHIFSYDENYLFLKNVLKNQEIKSIKIKWLKFGSFKEDIVWNLAYHHFYLVAGLIGSFALKNSTNELMEEHKIKFILETTSGVEVVIYIDREVKERSIALSVETLDNKYVWEDQSLFLVKDQKSKLINQSKKMPLPTMIEDFLELIDKKEVGLSNPLAYEAVKLIENLR